MAELTKLKDKADRLFSKYIRLKYSQDGYVTCYTCPTTRAIEHQQCGHFIKRAHLNTRWDEENCRVQCRACNEFLDGNYKVFLRRLKKEIGHLAFEALERRKNTLKIMKKADYELLIEDLKLKLKKYE